VLQKECIPGAVLSGSHLEVVQIQKVACNLIHENNIGRFQQSKRSFKKPHTPKNMKQLFMKHL